VHWIGFQFQNFGTIVLAWSGLHPDWVGKGNSIGIEIQTSVLVNFISGLKPYSPPISGGVA
jgi:hypothetical protein